jgi:hypothetical protein
MATPGLARGTDGVAQCASTPWILHEAHEKILHEGHENTWHNPRMKQVRA